MKKKTVYSRINMKRFRMERMLTQDDIAKIIGCSRQTYSNVERGYTDGTYLFWLAFKVRLNVTDEEMWSIIEKERCE